MVLRKWMSARKIRMIGRLVSTHPWMCTRDKAENVYSGSFIAEKSLHQPTENVKNTLLQVDEPLHLVLRRLSRQGEGVFRHDQRDFKLPVHVDRRRRL